MISAPKPPNLAKTSQNLQNLLEITILFRKLTKSSQNLLEISESGQNLFSKYSIIIGKY
jgi:hypothetical protein